MKCKKIRGEDLWGSGAWQARRGERKHNGEDVINEVLDPVLSDVNGRVTKIGYPYFPSDPEKGHLRYVEVTDRKQARIRYFYISPTVKKGDLILKGDQLGLAQDLDAIWTGMTQHYHFEVIAYVKPLEYIGE